VEPEGVLQWPKPCPGCSLHLSQMDTIDILTPNFINIKPHFFIYVELLKNTKYVIRMARVSVEIQNKQVEFFFRFFGVG
jgi:hypothetical protein